MFAVAGGATAGCGWRPPVSPKGSECRCRPIQVSVFREFVKGSAAQLLFHWTQGIRDPKPRSTARALGSTRATGQFVRLFAPLERRAEIQFRGSSAEPVGYAIERINSIDCGSAICVIDAPAPIERSGVVGPTQKQRRASGCGTVFAATILTGYRLRSQGALGTTHTAQPRARGCYSFGGDSDSHGGERAAGRVACRYRSLFGKAAGCAKQADHDDTPNLDPNTRFTDRSHEWIGAGV